MGWVSFTGVEFNKRYNTYVIAYCLDTDEFFVTNQQYWYWQYNKEFLSEQEGIEYFENNVGEFIRIANDLRKGNGYCELIENRPIFLTNTNKNYGGKYDN